MTIEIIRSLTSVLVVVRQRGGYGVENVGWAAGRVTGKQSWKDLFSAARLHLRQECGF